MFRVSPIRAPMQPRRKIRRLSPIRWPRGALATFLNLLEEPSRAQHPQAGEVAAFEEWMRHERGWTEGTVSG